MRLTPESSCPNSTKGHTYKIVKGEWTCTNCGHRL